MSTAPLEVSISIPTARLEVSFPNILRNRDRLRFLQKMGSNISTEHGDLTATEEKVRKEIQDNPVLMYSTTVCGWCRRAKGELDKMKVEHKEVKLDSEPDGLKIAQVLTQITKQRTVPNIFIGGKHLGGYDNLMKGVAAGTLEQSFKESHISYDPAYFTY